MATAGNTSLNAKLVLLGDMGAGKSSLVLRFVKGQFLEFQESTIGAAFFSQTLALNDATVKFEIWDTAGQERYHSLAPMYYRGAAAAVIVYDISSTESFTRAKKWVQELQKQGNSSMVMALAGNKADLLEKRQVAAELVSDSATLPGGPDDMIRPWKNTLSAQADGMTVEEINERDRMTQMEQRMEALKQQNATLKNLINYLSRRHVNMQGKMDFSSWRLLPRQLAMSMKYSTK